MSKTNQIFSNQITFDSGLRSVLSYAELESAVNGLADGVSIYDRQLRVLYQNKVILERYGPALWEKCHVAYHTSHTICADCPSVRTLLDAKVHTTIRQVEFDGERAFVELRSSPIFNGRGEVVAVSEVTRDITVRETTKIKLEEALHKVTEQQRQIEADLALAEQVHKSLIPSGHSDENLHIDVRYVPVQGVGGDYADIIPVGDGKYYTIIFDISGHGIAPALLANRVSGEINRIIARRPEPADLLVAINTFLLEHFDETGLYLTFFCCLFDMNRHTLTYSGGGHLPAVLIKAADGAVTSQQLKSQNGVLGVFDNPMEPEPQHTIDICNGDKLILYTDGLVEAGQSLGLPTTLAGLVALFESCQELSPAEFSNVVIDQITARMGSAFEDDLTLMTMQVMR